MNVLLVNGSPRANGNTARALKEVADTLVAEGIDVDQVTRLLRAAGRRISRAVAAHLLCGRGIRENKACGRHSGLPSGRLHGGIPVHEHAL